MNDTRATMPSDVSDTRGGLDLGTLLHCTAASPHAFVVLWGAELEPHANDALLSVMDLESARGLVTAAARQVQETGIPQRLEEELAMVDRGRAEAPEETWVTLSISPVDDVAGGPPAVLVAVDDVTEDVIRRRQGITVRDLAMLSAEVDSVLDAARLTLDVLSGNRMSVPFAAFYLPRRGDGALELAGSFGVDVPCDLLPLVAGPGTPVHEVLGDRRPRSLATFGEDDVDPVPLGGSCPEQASVQPVCPRPGADSQGVLVLGVNPHLPYDDSYDGFMALVAREVGRVLNDVTTQLSLRDEAENLQYAVGSNRRIGAAVGIVMADLQVDDDAAFAVLRRLSNQTNRRLVEIADLVVERGTVLGTTGDLTTR